MVFALAVIWKTKYGNRYVNPGNAPLSEADINRAKEYDEFLRQKMKDIKVTLKMRGFFAMKGGIKKWYLLGEQLQFLDDAPLRKICDPDMDLTWRALYDIAPELSPTGKLPREKERAEGARNHYLMCYRLARFDSLDAFEKSGINWQKFNDVCMSFGPTQMKDRKRLLEWLGIGEKKANFRLALQAIRQMSGIKSIHKTDTTLLSKEELFKALDIKFDELKAKRKLV